MRLNFVGTYSDFFPRYLESYRALTMTTFRGNPYKPSA